MKKNAFTLIELLAVIVILAIIALIAVPIVIHIINDSKKSSEEQSLELYRDSVQKAIAKYQLQHSEFNPSKCSIQTSGDIKCGTVDISVEMKGDEPSNGTIIIKNNKVNLQNILLNDKIYYEKGILIDDSDNNGEISVGDKYTYKVNENDRFNFYVLSINTDSTVNLIMDRNICNDGTTNYTSTNNYCNCKWYSSSKNNRYGPTTAMQELYNATKGWTNIPDILINYTDENNIDDSEKGYTSIITSNGVTTIIGKPTTNTTTIGTASKPLKARLPKEDEVNGAGCKAGGANGSCPAWLIENMQYLNTSNDKYSINNNDEAYQNIQGYWLLASSLAKDNYATYIRYSGYINSFSTTLGGVGVRPVITIPEDYLSS